ncbi:unnamed protein product [Rotaria sp. Silwood2]|nr:unnamed protein product [Rotaria sp. Silwood2]
MESVNSSQSEPVTMKERIQPPQIVLPCSSYNETLAFFKDKLGFQVENFFPADDPAVAIISGYGLHIRLERDTNASNLSVATIRLPVSKESQFFVEGITELIAPNGTKIKFVEVASKLEIPLINQSLIINRLNIDSQWVIGRGGIKTRDVIPGRQGGRFIVSHIQIPNGGPVKDFVHSHDVRFQMVYAYKGSMSLVYENQGDPFVYHAGDCILQPPMIRHQLLECSSGLEVLAIACPAVHNTYVDNYTKLPNTNQLSDHDYRGQHFVKYIAAEDKSKWQPWRLSGFECRDTGISAATQDMAGVRIIRSKGDLIKPQLYDHLAEFVFTFVLSGEFSLEIDRQRIEKLTAGDAFVMPQKLPYSVIECSKDIQLLELSLPGNITSRHLNRGCSSIVGDKNLTRR